MKNSTRVKVELLLEFEHGPLEDKAKTLADTARRIPLSVKFSIRPSFHLQLVLIVVLNNIRPFRSFFSYSALQ